MKAYYRSLTPLILWKHVERPINWAARFGRSAPLVVEIGTGAGEYLVRQAARHPELNFVGIEREWQSVKRALRRIADAQLTNARVLLGDATTILEHSFAPHSVDRFYSLFPCPWPKESHEKHRLFNQRFLAILRSKLKPTSQELQEPPFQIVTDHASYRDWIAAQTPGSGFTMDWQAIAPQFDTKYERKWRETGQTEFYQLSFYPTELSQPPHLSQEEIALETYCLPHFNPERFEPRSEGGALTVDFRDYLYDPSRNRAICRVAVIEDGLFQDFWIEINHKPEGWRAVPSDGCLIVPTVGVQRALDLVKEAMIRSAES